jgi:hypothetical protein
MAYGIIILGITGIGIFWILSLLKKECNGRSKEHNLVQLLAEEIEHLRKDVNELKK